MKLPLEQLRVFIEDAKKEINGALEKNERGIAPRLASILMTTLSELDHMVKNPNQDSEERAINLLVQLNNSLGRAEYQSKNQDFFNHHYPDDEELRIQLHQDIVKCIGLEPASKKKEEQLFHEHRLHPYWLINKHLHAKNPISVEKFNNRFLEPHEIDINENDLDDKKTRKTSSSDEEDDDIDLKQQVAMFKKHMQGGHQYTEDLNFQAIVHWIQEQHSDWLTAGTAKGGTTSMSDMIKDGLAVLTFAGPLMKDGPRDTSSYFHGPGFLLIPPETAKRCAGQYNKRIWDIPVEEITFVVQNDADKGEIIKNLEQGGIISPNKLEVMKARIFTYEQYVATNKIQPAPPESNNALSNMAP